VMSMKKGDLVYVPSGVTLLSSAGPDPAVGSRDFRWLALDEPSMALIIEPYYNNENIYHKIHLKGDSWLVRVLDTEEVSSAC